MEAQTLFTSLTLLIISIIFILHKTLSQKKACPNLPPSPPGWLPIIGHIHLLKNLLHRTLYAFSQNVGPIFSLRFGRRLVVVISSSALVEECFSKNDLLLANRPIASLDRSSLGYSATTVIGAPYGPHWRNLRKLCDAEVFTPTRLASFLAIRRDEMDRAISRLLKISCGGGFTKVNVESVVVELTFNNIMRMVAGKRYYGAEAEDDEEAKGFRDITREALELTSASDVCEIFPMLRWIGCNAVENRLKAHKRKTDEFMQGLLRQHRRRKTHGNTMLDHLLSLQQSQPQYYTDEIITGLILALIIAGTDASVITTEWMMTLLLNHPNVLTKARQEVDAVVGHHRLVEEHDLPKLTSVPLLVPHVPSQDVRIGGYDIPKDTMMLVNAWAIHRDPKVWHHPSIFQPERFENMEVETHKLLPFGMGRRACPGAGLAQKFVGLAVGSLIQCFDWERPHAHKIDMTEGSGTTLPKTNMLEALCKPRQVMDKILQQLPNDIN